MRNLSLFLSLAVLCSQASSETSDQRSLKTSLNQVLRDVKSKLDFFFSRKQQKKQLKPGFIKAPMEAILPVEWFKDDREAVI